MRDNISYLYNEPVWVDDQHKWQHVYPETVENEVASAEPILGEVVSAAGCHVAFRYVP